MTRTGQHGVISPVKIINFDRENSWCRVVEVTIAVASDKAAGKIEAYLVNRPGLLQDCKAYFHYFMYKPTQVLCDLALRVFDRHGHLKPHLYGTFGPETNDGGLLYIRQITLKQKYRGKGIGRSAVGQLLRQLNSTYHERASWGLAVMRHEDCETSWRPEGFRVIDRSDYIACCSAKDHRCWNQSEQDPPSCSSIEAPIEGLELVLGHAIIGPDLDYGTSPTTTGGRRLADMRVVIGLVAAGADVNKSMALHNAVAAQQKACIQYLAAEGADVNGQDHKGSTPLHIAACEGKLEYVQLLVRLGANCASKDHMGYTPLDVCTLKMQNLRDIAGIADTFTAHQDAHLAITGCLQEAALRQNLHASVASIPFYRSKQGCTCGQCSGGFLSPRMKHRLIWTANETVDMVDDSIDDCIPEWPCDLTNNLCMENLWLFEYVPLPLRERVSKSFAKGWHATLDIIAKLLEANVLPMATAVKATAELPSQRPTAQCCHPKAARFFLQKGGRVEYALDAILSHSRVEHEVVGNKAIYEHDEFLEENAALPSCENDTDYNMVKRLLCNDGLEPNGPYGVMLDDYADNESDANDDIGSTQSSSDDRDQDSGHQDRDETPPDRGAWLDAAASSMSH
ncbi:hypothetical protein WJX77_010566 [Trebouxia sp. C0004]